MIKIKKLCFAGKSGGAKGPAWLFEWKVLNDLILMMIKARLSFKHRGHFEVARWSAR